MVSLVMKAKEPLRMDSGIKAMGLDVGVDGEKEP